MQDDSEAYNPMTDQHPLVSWILCCHVLSIHFRSSIESCLNQTYSNFELIIVANGVDAIKIADSLVEWLGDDSRVRIFVTEVHQLSYSLSLGLHHAKGPLIARMDSDDISRPNRLELQVAFMHQHPEVTVLGTCYEIIDEGGEAQREVLLPESDSAIRRSLLFGNPLCHPSVMFRREAVLRAGGYLGSLHAEDYDLWARLSLDSKCHFANLKEVCLGYRVLGVGEARRSRYAYASIAASQLRIFLIGGGFRWWLASYISIAKLLLRSSPIRDHR